MTPHRPSRPPDADPAPRHRRARCWALALTLGGLCGLATAQSALAPLAAVTPQLVAPALAIEVLRLRADATAHEHGEGVARDGARAAALYCQAARLGDAASLYSLGWMHAHGRGVPRDDAQAAWFFAAAAALGDAPSRRMLASLGPAADQVPDCLRPPEAPPAPPVAVAMDDPPPVFQAVLRSVPPQAPKAIVDLVKKLAPQYQLEPHLVLAIMAAESNFDPTVVSPKNAQGLMQLIPDTAARFNVRDPFDPAQSIKGGMAYLRWLMAYFEGDVTLVAAAYNAGEGMVERHKGVPPFAETRAYIERIRRFVGDLVLPFDARVTRPSPHLRQGRGNG